ncbi:MAG: hypothetical protein WBW78_00275 [Terrimicrobiaceae bacterium]
MALWVYGNLFWIWYLGDQTKLTWAELSALDALDLPVLTRDCKIIDSSLVEVWAPE